MTHTRKDIRAIVAREPSASSVIRVTGSVLSTLRLVLTLMSSFGDNREWEISEK
jgi:hypothetical protein